MRLFASQKAWKHGYRRIKKAWNTEKPRKKANKQKKREINPNVEMFVCEQNAVFPK